jgi:hypothetical protein
MTIYTTRLYIFVCDVCERDTGEIIPTNPDDGRRSAWRDAHREGWTDTTGSTTAPATPHGNSYTAHPTPAGIPYLLGSATPTP